MAAFAVLALALVVSGAGPASAVNGDNGKPDSTGNNGTLKVHEQGTPSGTESNDPKVCTFNLEGFNFDPGQDLVLAFQVQGGDEPTGQVPSPNEFSVQADSTGSFASLYFNNGENSPTVVAGHYKVTAYGKDTGTGEFTDVKAKSKVFKVSCGAPAPETGTVTVTKALADGSAPAPAHKPFSITVVCEKGDYSETFEFTLAVGASKELTGLPVGAVCTVSEKTTDGWQPPTIAPNPVTVEEDATVAVTVTNFKPNEGEGKTGTVTVTKELAEGSTDPTAGQTFPVTVTCEKHEEVVYAHTFDLAVGASATTDPLPVGTKCTVGEEPPDGWNVPTFEPKATVTVKKDGTTVTVLNFQAGPTPPPPCGTGKLKVTKELAAGSAPAGDQKFPMTVTCEKAGYSDTFEFDLAVGESKELKKLPAGAVCTVNEAEPSGWNAPTFDPQATVTVAKHETVEVTVVNSRTVTPPPQPVLTPHISLLKENQPTANEPLEPGETITFTLTATNDGQVGLTGVVVSDVVPTGTTYVTDSAKCLGWSPCTVTQPAAAPATVSWALGTMNPGESAKVTFHVTVNTGLDPDTVITNVGTVASSLTSAVSNEVTNQLTEVEGEVIVGPTTPTVTPAAVEGETLPATGASVPVGYLVDTGVGLVALGALLTALSRRRRDST